MDQRDQMNDEVAQDQPSGGMSLGDIYFILFRRKWIIIICGLLGVCAAATLFVIKPPRYRSEAKLFIRYVAEGKTPAPSAENASATRSLNEKEASILNTEAQIIQSLDVARGAAIAVGVERILAKDGGGTNVDWAADVILSNLEIDLMPHQGSVISLIYQHKDPEIAREVLKQVIVAYIKKHKEMHQNVGLFEDVFVKETTRLRSELASTEQKLREKRMSSGIISVDQSKKDYAAQIGRIREELLVSQADLARQRAILEELPKFAANNSEPDTNTQVRIPLDQVSEYRNVTLRLEMLVKQEQELLVQFTPSSVPVRDKRDQIAIIKEAKKKLEQQYPELATMLVVSHKSSQPTGTSLDFAAATVQVKALSSTIELLTSQLAQIQADAARLEEVEAVITDLERTKKLQEDDLKYFTTSLEQSRMEGALGAGKAPNIIPINSEPTGAAKEWSKSFKKKVQMVGVGGLIAGLALALIIELFLDRSVKRPADVERKLRLPLFISIPDISRNGRHRAKKPSANGQTPGSPGESIGWPVPSWDRNHPLRRFYEGLRDRLIVHFEVRNVAKKPKFVGVTSCGKGVGVSSTAAGLAAALSETGDGNVLLVDMNAEQGSAQQFHKGKLNCGLDDALAPETMKSARVQSNLYVVAETVGNGKLPQILPRRFAHLVPKLEASQYDYIIFDMPCPRSQRQARQRDWRA
jgi:polysaccharide biosynthesis transport protein